MHVTSSLRRDLAERCAEQVLLKLDTGRSPLRVNDVFDGPACTVSPADLRVGDDALTTALASDKAGEALTTTLDEVEPLVLAERAMTVGDAGSLEQDRDGSDVGLSHPALDLDVMHLANIPSP